MISPTISIYKHTSKDADILYNRHEVFTAIVITVVVVVVV